jgi:hypothetical protein
MSRNIEIDTHWTWIAAPTGAKSASVVAVFCNFRDIYLLQGGRPLQPISFLPPLCVYVFVYSDYGFYRSLGIACGLCWMCMRCLFGCLVVARTLPYLVSLPCSRRSCSHSTFSHHSISCVYPVLCTLWKVVK